MPTRGFKSRLDRLKEELGGRPGKVIIVKMWPLRGKDKTEEEVQAEIAAAQERARRTGKDGIVIVPYDGPERESMRRLMEAGNYAERQRN